MQAAPLALHAHPPTPPPNPPPPMPPMRAANPWLSQRRLVVKPDCLFGKRGKHDLVGLNLDAQGAGEFIAARMNKVPCPGGGG